MQTDISADTQSTLLLAAPLWKRPKDGPTPLTSVEYDELAAALRSEGLRPRDLLGSSVRSTLSPVVARFPVKIRERVTPDRLARLLERGGQLALALSHWSGAGIWVVSRADAMYPSRYKSKLKRSAPPVVYGVGSPELLERGGLAVVGSRKPDESSAQYTAHVGRWAAQSGVQIVSGAARGVDETAMLVCAQAGGTALGVVAESLLKLSTRREFREAILSGCLTLISSFDPDAGFSVPNAMARNRWIYAMAERALVVACSEGRGGTWAGAIEALRRDVPVYVRTGNPERPGNDALIRRGALAAPDDLSALWTQEHRLPVQPSFAPLSSVPQSADLYAVVAPELLRLLQQPLTAKQLAETAGLTKSQADAWLKRLLDEGRIEKVKATFRAVGRSHEQPALF